MKRFEAILLKKLCTVDREKDKFRLLIIDYRLPVTWSHPRLAPTGAYSEMTYYYQSWIESYVINLYLGLAQLNQV